MRSVLSLALAQDSRAVAARASVLAVSCVQDTCSAAVLTPTLLDTCGEVANLLKQPLLGVSQDPVLFLHLLQLRTLRSWCVFWRRHAHQGVDTHMQRQ